MKIKIILCCVCFSLPALADGYPAWVMNPSVEVKDDKVAASACTVTTGDLSMDRTLASTDARAELVKQFEIALQNESEITKNSEAVASNKAGKVTRKSKTTISVNDTTEAIAQAVLKNSKIIKAEYHTVNAQSNFCTLVSVTKSSIGQ
ncbi:hypothetical protein [Shewanella atlantica]|uniref:Uncharacterized protein n=1 Tax=Shewanella atlantica TaxID=271099 RepID=A0A431WCV6_9GAMM|nr:hypothetical protein [Shewanella atlantica]RTR33209.1 hypothetical protein EKG39_05530 [Shewanella atlantica]